MFKKLWIAKPFLVLLISALVWLIIVIYSVNHLQNNDTTQQLKVNELQTSTLYPTTTTKIKTSYLPGDYGKPYDLNVNDLNPIEKVKYNEGWNKYEFNQYLSDMIPVNRVLSDIRDPE